MNIEAERIAAVLGGSQTLGHSVRTLRELDDVVRAGMPRAALDSLLNTMAIEGVEGEWTTQLRNKIVPRATYQRAERLNLQVSEATERFARLYAILLDVFQDPAAASRFLTTPHPELAHRTPFDVALTETGGRAVEEVIERGMHGLPV